MIKIGTRSICKLCNKDIEFTGKYWDHIGPSKPRHIPLPITIADGSTDLDRFSELYKSFGVECKVIKEYSDEEHFWYYSIKFIQEHDYDRFPGEETRSDKFDGWSGFYSEVRFKESGEFLTQGFWE